MRRGSYLFAALFFSVPVLYVILADARHAGSRPREASAPPPVDLTANRTTFAATDTIEILADVQPLTVPSYPFVRVLMANGSTLYYERGRGFTDTPTPYLGFAAGTVTTSAPLMGYPVLSARFSGLMTGMYHLEGGAVDMEKTTSASNLVYLGDVDRETLTVE